MLRRLFGLVVKKKSKSQKDEVMTKHHLPIVVPRSQHQLSRSDISENALKVLYRLKKHNYEGYLVGGGVRDILLGFHPKDFDVVTNAHPEQIRSVFNNCRLIGRRFRLAHVYFGRDIIEVATFRANGEHQSKESTSEQGLLLRDNVYGTLEEDVWRRDFTVNALYYNIKDFSLVDYVGGLEDLNNRILRMIGEPDIRFREDPVRMLRAIRLACKLDLRLADDLPKPLYEHAALLAHVPSARLYEETLKMFHSGKALVIVNMLKEFKLFDPIFPMVKQALAQHTWFQDFLDSVLVSTDQRIQESKSVNPAFIFSALLWGPLKSMIASVRAEQGIGEFPATMVAADRVFQQQRKTLSFPKRISLMVKEIWLMQIRFERRRPSQIDRLLKDPRFRAAYDFFLLRGESGNAEEEAINWWRSFVEGDEKTRHKLLKSSSGTKKRKKSKKKKSSKSEDSLEP